MNDTTYVFVVVAYNAAGNSGESSASNGVTPMGPSGPPDAPASVVATAGSGLATVSWAASDPHGSPITSYTVTAHPQPPETEGATRTVGENTTTAVISPLRNGSTYTFTVAATNAFGSSGPSSYSNAVTAEPFSSPIYAVLGDSYSSGQGAHESGLCARSEGAYGPQYAQRYADPIPTVVMLACGGATTQAVRSAQIPSLPSNTDLITLTAGGDDAGFAGVMQACVVSLTSCVDLYPNAEATILAVRPSLVALYREIRAAAPTAAVYALTYPLFVTNDNRVPYCAGDFGISPEEKEWIRARTTDLNNVIRSAAAEASVIVVTQDSTFAGHEICTAEEYINGLSTDVTSFHPNEAGYLQEASVLASVIQ